MKVMDGNKTLISALQLINFHDVFLGFVSFQTLMSLSKLAVLAADEPPADLTNRLEGMYAVNEMASNERNSSKDSAGAIILID